MELEQQQQQDSVESGQSIAADAMTVCLVKKNTKVSSIFGFFKKACQNL